MFPWPTRHMPLMPEPLPQLPKPAWPDKKWQCLYAWHSHSAEADSAFCLAISATHGALTALAQKNSDALSQRSTAPVCALPALVCLCLLRSHSAFIFPRALSALDDAAGICKPTTCAAGRPGLFCHCLLASFRTLLRQHNAIKGF